MARRHRTRTKRSSIWKHRRRRDGGPDGRQRDFRADRPQAAALVAAVADPNPGFDAIVAGEYERAFCGNQLLRLMPLLARHGVELWLPELDGPFHTADMEHHRHYSSHEGEDAVGDGGAHHDTPRRLGPRAGGPALTTPVPVGRRTPTIIYS